ncbi:unnamed protein product [Soboliphyme baturini]|uniref:Cyclin N-terminal domain-containing protein n=1 Tax=Soboliphyme baturini TaxID=241478 RepID=A0A183IK72_9BILA|nr:unnamed protein product [Soboliphyme baturini]
MEFTDSPDFLAHSAIAADSLMDFQFILTTENSERLKKCNRNQGLFIQKRCVEFLFNACHQLHLTSHVRYTASLIFDSFLIEHVNSLWQYVLDNCEDKKIAKLEWQNLEDKIASQMTLRVLSCIQIASKLHSHCRMKRIHEITHIPAQDVLDFSRVICRHLVTVATGDEGMNAS